MIKGCVQTNSDFKNGGVLYGVESKEEAEWCKAYRISQAHQTYQADFSNKADPTGQTHRSGWPRILLERLGRFSSTSPLVDGID